MSLRNDIEFALADEDWKTVNEILPLVERIGFASNVSCMCRKLCKLGFLERRERNKQSAFRKWPMEYEYRIKESDGGV